MKLRHVLPVAIVLWRSSSSHSLARPLRTLFHRSDPDRPINYFALHTPIRTWMVRLALLPLATTRGLPCVGRPRFLRVMWEIRFDGSYYSTVGTSQSYVRYVDDCENFFLRVTIGSGDEIKAHTKYVQPHVEPTLM